MVNKPVDFRLRCFIGWEFNPGTVLLKREGMILPVYRNLPMGLFLGFPELGFLSELGLEAFDLTDDFLPTIGDSFSDIIVV